MEPGRAIAGTTAILVTRVEGEKTKAVRDESGRRTAEERWLVIDAGANTLLEHTNYDWYFRTVVANRADRAATAHRAPAGGPSRWARHDLGGVPEGLAGEAAGDHVRGVRGHRHRYRAGRPAAHL